MTTTEGLIFMAMVFCAIVLLAAAMIVPTAGTAAQANRKMRQRIGRHLEALDPGTLSLLREQYLRELSPLERGIENLSVVAPLSAAVEQSGVRTSAAKVLLKGLFFGLIVAVLVQVVLGQTLLAMATGAAVFALPIVDIFRKRAGRHEKFEAQLPEALDIMSRALKAGHPFNETLQLVAEEMDDPIAGEFGRVFSDLNYGLPLKSAFHGTLTRVPSMSLHTLVTAVLIQAESGGALAEILEKVAAVIRGRFRLQRKLRTLSAEGRLSAWILSLIPFVLAVILTFASPDYLPGMLREPIGQQMILAAFLMMIIGIFWIRKIIRIQV